MTRPSWPAYWLGVATAAAARASCPRASVGAVAVDTGNCIIVSGYNGAASGEPHCLDVGCDIVTRRGRDSCHRARHAEANMVAFARKHGRSLAGATVYVTLQPCRECAELLIAAGVAEVVHQGEYPDAYAVTLMVNAGIVLRRMQAAAPTDLPPDLVFAEPAAVISPDHAASLYHIAVSLLDGLAKMPTGSIILPEGTAEVFDEWARDWASADPSLAEILTAATTASTKRPYRDRPQITRLRN